MEAIVDLLGKKRRAIGGSERPMSAVGERSKRKNTKFVLLT